MNEERKALFEMRYNNSLFDLMYFSFLKSCSGILLLVFIGVVVYNSYFHIYSRIGSEDMLMLAILITRFIAIVFGVMTAVTVAQIVFLNFIGKLKGIIGEHFLYFYEDEFVEKTPFNRSVYKYSPDIKVYSTFGYYFIINKRAEYFVVPKRNMNENEKKMFLSYLQKEKPATTIIIPFIFTAVVFFSFVFFQANLNIRKYTINISPVPFMIFSGAEEFFVTTGMHLFRSSMTYGNLLGLREQSPEDLKRDPSNDVKFENKITVVSENGAKNVNLPQNIRIMRIMNFEGDSFLLSIDDSDGTYKIFKWDNEEFVEYNEMDYKKFMRKVADKNRENEENEDVGEKRMSDYLGEYEFEERAGGKEYVEMKLGDKSLKIFYKRSDEIEDDGKAKYLLYGELSNGRKDVFADFISGQFEVSKKEYDDFNINN